MSQAAIRTLQGDLPLDDAKLPQKTLADILYDGFYMLFLIRNRHAPPNAAEFVSKIRGFLDDFERDARRNGASAEDLYDAKYAFCAAVDETVLGSELAIRSYWESHPLQLSYFGDQLAGENFFNKLEQLRAQGAARVQALEVFYLCLLLGFKGKYALDGSEKLHFLVLRVGDELAHFKGRRASFAPFWKAPDTVKHRLRSEVPLWAFAAVLAFFGILAFIGLRSTLGHHTDRQLAAYQDVVKLPSRSANVSITLP